MKMQKMDRKPILKKLDLYLSIFLIVSSVLILVLYTYFIGFDVKVVTNLIFVIIGLITNIFLRDRKYIERQELIQNAKTYRLLLNIAFISIMTVSFLLLYKDLYIRSLSYFISISFLSVLIFLELKVSNCYLILPKILLLSVNLRIGLLYKFPSILGGDGAYHYGLIKAALITGDIVGQTGFIYSEHPIPHINTLTHMLITGVNYKDALTTSWAIPLSIISIFFMYLIGKLLFTEEIGLLSSLLLVLFPFDIWHSTHLAPMAFATVFIPLMIYFFLNNKSNYHFVFGIMSLVIIALSHPLTTLIVFIIGFGFFLGSLFYRITDKNSQLFPFFYFIFIFLTKWIFLSNKSWIGWIARKISDFYIQIILILSDRTLISEITSSNLRIVAGNLSIFDGMLNTLGFSIFLYMSIIGILFILRRNNNTIQIVEMLFAAVLICIIVFGSSSIGLAIRPHRWFDPLGMLLVIPVAIGIQRVLVKKSLSVPIIFIMTFFMITNSIANQDSPIYANEDTVRWAFTESEIYAADWSFQKANNILFDKNYGAYLKSLKFRYESIITSNDDGVILIRDYILEHAFYQGEKYILAGNCEKGNYKRLENTHISILNEQEKNTIINLYKTLSKVYENGNARTYYQKPLKWIYKEK